MKKILTAFFIMMTFLALPLSSSNAVTPEYYVSPTGSDSNPGTQSQPWLTISKAANSMPTGSTAIVLEGSYPEGVFIGRSNLTFIAQGQVITKYFWISGDSNKVKGFETTDPNSNFGIRVQGNGNLIEGNNIHHTMQDGIWFFGSNNTFRGNYVHDIIQRATDPHIDCFQTWGPAFDIVFERNVCHNPNTYGSNQIVMLENRIPPVGNLTFRNNIFIMDDEGYSPMVFSRKDGQAIISNISIINNVIAHRTGIGQYGIQLKNITGATVRNNLFINYGDRYSSYVVTSGSTDINMSNNAIYKSDGISPYGGPYPGDVWMQDPEVKDINGLNFHLLSSSPLIDKGYSLGSAIVDDFDGGLRPQGSGFDIGAFEYQQSQSTTLTPIPPVTNTPLPTLSSTSLQISATSTTMMTNTPEIPKSTYTLTTSPTLTQTPVRITSTSTPTSFPTTMVPATATNTALPTLTRTPTFTSTSIPTQPASKNVSSMTFQAGVAPNKNYAGSADALLSQASPSTNFGKSDELQISGLSGSEVFGLIRWDLTKIPASKNVISVSLGINVSGVKGQTYLLYQVLQKWDETQVTWNVASEGTNWQSPGAKGAQDRGTTILGTLLPTADGSYVISLNKEGIRVVQNWIHKDTPNYGFIIVGSPDATNIQIKSKENTSPSVRPQLTIQITGN